MPEGLVPGPEQGGGDLPGPHHQDGGGGRPCLQVTQATLPNNTLPTKVVRPEKRGIDYSGTNRTVMNSHKITVRMKPVSITSFVALQYL